MYIKKKMLVPVLMLCAIVSVFAFAYATQAFTANAQEEFTETNSEPSQANSDTQIAVKDIVATIHLSSNAPFTYGLSDSIYGFSQEQNSQGKEVVTFEDVTSIASQQINLRNKGDYIVISGRNFAQKAVAPFYWIKADKEFYDLSGVSVNYDYSGNNADVSVLVTPSCKIDFNANGGCFKDPASTPTVLSVLQGEYNKITVPDPKILIAPKGKSFGGWYTDPVLGQRIDEATQVPAWGMFRVLYAHWIDNTQPIAFKFSTNDLSKRFDVNLEKRSLSTNEVSESNENSVSSYTKVINQDNEKFGAIKLDKNDQKYVLVLTWNDNLNNESCRLTITPKDGLRINSLSNNDGNIDLNSYQLPYSQNNNIVLTLGREVGGFISVFSNDGSLFKCQLQTVTAGQPITYQNFSSDYIPIQVGPKDYVEYWYGPYTEQPVNMLNSGEENYTKANDAVFVIRVRNDFEGTAKTYAFCDLWMKLFDWLDISSSITGVDFNGRSMTAGNYHYTLNNGFNTFMLKMSGYSDNIPIIYDANGGHFSDTSSSITKNVSFGDNLPAVEIPVLDNSNFIGWFTDPVGGEKVDPNNIDWALWQEWADSTLYAHWTFNSQSVS